MFPVLEALPDNNGRHLLSLASTKAVTDSGILATIKFEAVGAGDSPAEHQNGGGHEREVAALAAVLAVVAGVSWHRYRRQAV